MKKNFKLVALAVATMAFAVACNNNAPADQLIDTIVPEDTTICEEVDSVVVEEIVPEETPTTPKKAATKKKEEVKKSNGDRPVEIAVKKELKKRVEQEVNNLETATKDDPNARPVAIAAKKELKKRGAIQGGNQ